MLIVNIVVIVAAAITEYFGREEDVIEFYKSDDRKSIVSVNGTVLFKVRELYTDRLRENVTALIDGGEIKIDW